MNLEESGNSVAGWLFLGKREFCGRAGLKHDACDNTKVNQRDRNSNEPTSDQQKMLCRIATLRSDPAGDHER